MWILSLLLSVAYARLGVSQDTSELFSTDSSSNLCAIALEESQGIVDLVEVALDETLSQDFRSNDKYPRVLCMVNTVSTRHNTKAQAIAETWGQRCTKLVFFSNTSDTIVVAAGSKAEYRFDVISVDVPAGKDHTWQIQKARLEYVYTHFRNDFDWFYKADDDAYVIMENLHNYLKRPEILDKTLQEPMQLGHRFSLPDEFLPFYIKNDTLASLWLSTWDHLIYSSGGPGYAINALYLDQLVKSMIKPTCLPDSNVPIDLAIAFCMTWNGVSPWNTRDHDGHDRWHAVSPGDDFITPVYWFQMYRQHVGGVHAMLERPAPDSVAFHYISPELMHHIDRSLYRCRENSQDITSFGLDGQVMIS
ncbi:hypothetical protein PF005_g8749 [Phytophthora fragariae]|uniref:N-acetylgalactosaminide beta-1,3-galactosyltransferase n=1 Tax=Phytophthora fragariae TaxID=53985 RepID=A0A6A3SLH6_9STRA|nr:hypothetical protein PF003_g15662 [Phytophthora fragariae]KAE8940516.1 hypothetical protein PF009_g9664 [Phytophthora fragariae]KAE9015242.1 hypothetical protein PF011_g7704 [Phytophthora fragariae]KAE9118562.1 hypothetical protein PF007_g8875 [Phytophthora fragariae]KAE9118962.1 hypothetical protein PF010_g8021 [Phytophthora fragariae]